MRTKSVRQFGCSNVRLFGGRKEAGRRREEISDFEFDGLKNSRDSGDWRAFGGIRLGGFESSTVQEGPNADYESEELKNSMTQVIR
jgi:hypothetical protein